MIKSTRNNYIESGYKIISLKEAIGERESKDIIWKNRNICSLYYCNALWHGYNASVMYRESSALLWWMYYELILRQRDWTKRGDIVIIEDLCCIEDKEAYEKANSIMINYII